MALTKIQFSRAYALARSHGHWWAVEAPPATWVAAAIAAQAYTAMLAANAECRASGPTEEFAAARENTRAAHAALDAALEEAPWGGEDFRGPAGPEELPACRAIARRRNQWEGIDLVPDPDGVVRHRTCSGSTSWDVDPDGWVTIRRHSADGEVTASATVGGRGSYEIEAGEGNLQDLQRLSECLRALGCERGARNCLLLASPSDLSAKVAEFTKAAEAAASAKGPYSGWCEPPEVWERAAAPLRAALGVLRTAGQGRAVYAAARFAYLG
jgi:hypothetical protein